MVPCMYSSANWRNVISEIHGNFPKGLKLTALHIPFHAPTRQPPGLRVLLPNGLYSEAAVFGQRGRENIGKLVNYCQSLRDQRRAGMQRNRIWFRFLFFAADGNWIQAANIFLNRMGKIEGPSQMA